jgi:hypothetical protein
VSHHACRRLNDAEREQEARPDDHGRAVPLDEPVLHRAPDRVRHQRLRDHPRDPEEDAGDERAELVPSDPDEQPDRRARVGLARVVDRQANRATEAETTVHGEVRNAVPRRPV